MILKVALVSHNDGRKFIDEVARALREGRAEVESSYKGEFKEELQYSTTQQNTARSVSEPPLFSVLITWTEVRGLVE